MSRQFVLNSSSLGFDSLKGGEGEQENAEKLTKIDDQQHALSVRAPKTFNIEEMNMVLAMQWKYCKWDFYLEFWRNRPDSK